MGGPLFVNPVFQQSGSAIRDGNWEYTAVYRDQGFQNSGEPFWGSILGPVLVSPFLWKLQNPLAQQWRIKCKLG